MTKSPLLMAVSLLFLSTLTVAEIKSLTISNDSRPVILLENFRIIETGLVSVSVSFVSVTSPSYSPIQDSSKLEFFVLSKESLSQVLLEIQQNPSFCILDSRYVIHLFTFRDISPPLRPSGFHQSYPITYPNDYFLFFANCVPETWVSMKVKTETYSIDTNGSKDYLSTGSTLLPGSYLFFSLCYLIFLLLWVYSCYSNKQIVQKIHLVMAALLLTKALNLICAAEVKHYVKVTGTPQGWNIPFYIFRFIGDVLLYTVIILIGAGWSLKGKKLLMIVVPLQVLANVASIVIGETGPFIENWVLWNQIFLFVDVTCCLAIILPMVSWMCCSARKTSKSDEEAAKNLAKSPILRKFYVLVIVYLVFTRIGLFALNVMADYNHQWVSNAAGEISTLAFCILIFYMFRPMKKNDYFNVIKEEEEEEEATKLSLKEDRVGSETI